MYGTELRYNKPRYDGFLVIINIIRKFKRKIYLDITNKLMSTQQKMNMEQTKTNNNDNPLIFAFQNVARNCTKIELLGYKITLNCVTKVACLYVPLKINH